MGRQSTGGRDCGRWEVNRLAKKWKSEVNYLDQAHKYKRFFFIYIYIYIYIYTPYRSADHSWPETVDAKHQPQILTTETQHYLLTTPFSHSRITNVTTKYNSFHQVQRSTLRLATTL